MHPAAHRNGWRPLVVEAAMLRPVLLLVLLIAGCSKSPQADLQYIAQARSLTAEWALINEQAAHGKLTSIYVETMRQSVREQLQSVRRSLADPESNYGQEIAALLTRPDAAAPRDLRARAGKLKQIEDDLESA